MAADPGAAGAGKAVLIFAYYYPPENTSGAARPSRFARFLPEFGYQPRIVSAGDRAEGFRGAGAVLRVPDESAGAAARLGGRAGRLFQRWLLPYEEHLPWVSYAVEAGCRVAAERPAAMLSTSPPIATHMAALAVKRRLGIRWIADFRDPMAGNPFRQSRRSRIYDPILERAVFRHADAVVANTSMAADVWRERYPQWRGKIHTIWNGFDPAEKLPVPRPGRGGRRVLAHVGNLYADRHPGALLHSLDRLMGRGLIDPETLRISLVGGIERMHLPMDQPPFSTFEERGWLERRGVVPRAEAQQAAADADALLLLDINAMDSGLQVPAKLFDYVRLGKPVLAFTSRGSAVEEILGAGGVAHACVYTNDPREEADRKILSFLTSSPGPQTPSDWFLESFDARRQTETLCSLIDPANQHRPKATGQQASVSR